MNMFFSCNIRQLWQTIWSLPVLVALVLTLSLTGASSPVFAVHDVGLFELDTRTGVDGDQDKKNDPIPPLVGDGNTTDDITAGVDWENIYCDAVGSALCSVPVSGAEVISWIEDTFANNPINSGAEAFVVARTPEDTFYTGGGSKDTNGIQDGPWKYKIQSDQVPDKNDIVNAFAALYDEGGIAYLFFGLDTFSVNGDANAGFWFFRNQIGLNAPDARGIGTFSGEHSDGDIFIAVAYTQGGRVGNIDIYEWDGDDATGSLLLIDSGQDCATVGAGDDVCGVINKLLPDDTFGEDPIFDYANTLVANNPDISTDPTSYQYESAAFVEFGMDVEAVIGRPLGCISTFLAETRSSQSETAQLKDFAFGSFEVCSIGVTKTGGTLSKVGDDVDYEIVVTNTGQETLYKQSITDTLLGDLASHCGPSLAPGASCTINVSRTVLVGDTDPLPNTVTVVYTEFADPLSLSFTDNASHSVNLFEPGISLVKTGDATLSKVGDSVNYTITVNNTSSADTPNLSCTISDALLGLNKAVNLASGASDVTNQTRAIQGGDPDPLTNTASVVCTVDGLSNAVNASDGHTVNIFQPGITLDKTGDTLAKVGDSVGYTITLNNTSSADTPDLVCTITDALLGLNKTVTLASGGSDVTNTSRTVQAGDPDPLLNTAEVDCSPIGYPNILEASDGHSVNLYQPDYSLTVACPATDVEAGEDVVYSLTVNNTSSGDSPDLQLVGGSDVKSITFDPIIQNLNIPLVINQALPASLASGVSATVSFSGTTIAAGDYKGMASATYSPLGFPNLLNRDAMDTCAVLAPAPALIILEKLLRNGAGIPFTYNTTGGATSIDVLTPVFNSTEIIASPFDQTFDAASNGFDRMDGAISVPIPTVTSTVTVMIAEVIQAGISLESLECTINRDSGRDGDIVIAGTLGEKATLTLGDLDTAECRWTNFIPGEGCTPGFWRNHLSLWDGLDGDDVSTAMTSDSFNVVFGVTEAESGLADSVTLQDTINLGGGGKKALARHATAAYISASATGIDFAFSPATVINIYQDGVDLFLVPDNYDVASAKDALAAENEKGCPFN